MSSYEGCLEKMTNEFAHYGVRILKEWEKLRIFYNAILIGIIVTGIWPIWFKITNYKIFLIENAVGFIQANILYFSGPFVEIIFRSLRRDISKYRIRIWAIGMFISVMAVLYSLMIVYQRYG